jgi:hypothetical protein
MSSFATFIDLRAPLPAALLAAATPNEQGRNE